MYHCIASLLSIRASRTPVLLRTVKHDEEVRLRLMLTNAHALMPSAIHRPRIPSVPDGYALLRRFMLVYIRTSD